MTSPAAVIRRLLPGDLAAVLALNQHNVPALGDLDRDRLERLTEKADRALVAEVGNELVAFVVALRPGADYDSPNYHWFADRYEDFLYIDRIAVADDHKGRGLGMRLYETLTTDADFPLLACEVNIRPPNPESMAFHLRLGFAEVGQQDTDGGDKRVALLARTLPQ